MPALELSIIIVNYNVKEFIANLIESLKTATQNIAYEIIISDNNSEDGSINYFKNNYKYLIDSNKLILIENDSNLGFGKANNKALAIAKGAYLLMLNPDTLVPEKTLERMFEFFKERPDVGLAGCKILNGDGTLQLASRRSFPGPWTSFTKVSGLSTLFPKSRLFARYNLTYLDENKSYEVDAVCGAFMMITREVYNKIGGFDEDFFMYGEDLDLCYRVQKAGYKVYYVHDAEITHFKGESTRRSKIDETKYFYNAMSLFVKKHLSGSTIVTAILNAAIFLRKLLTYLYKNRLILISILLDIIAFSATLKMAESIYALIRLNFYIPYWGEPFVYTIPVSIHIISAVLLKIYRKNSISIIKNLQAILFSFLIVSTMTYFFKDFAFSRGILLITYFILFFTLSLWRVIAKVFFKIGNISKRLAPIRFSVISNKNIGSQFEESNYVFAGSINPNNTVDSVDKNYSLGTLHNLEKIITNSKLDEIIIEDEISPAQFLETAYICRKENVELKTVGSNKDYITGSNIVEVADGMPLIKIEHNLSSFNNKLLKVCLDFLISFAGTLVILPFVFLKTKITGKTRQADKFILSLPNVLTRRKSLVGPKDNVGDNQTFGKPGLTGLWYIYGSEKNADKLDAFYAINQNLWLDIEILSKTFTKFID